MIKEVLILWGQSDFVDLDGSTDSPTIFGDYAFTDIESVNKWLFDNWFDIPGVNSKDSCPGFYSKDQSITLEYTECKQECEYRLWLQVIPMFNKL